MKFSFLIKRYHSISVYNKINFIALFIFIITAIFSIGFYGADEHYQILEFAQYKLGNIPAKALPWEYDSQMRPTLQPWIVIFLVKIFNFFNILNPFAIAMIFRLISALLLWWVTLRMNSLLVKQYFLKEKWAVLFSCSTFFLWFIPFLSVRFSSENYSAAFLLLGLCYILKNQFSLKDSILTGVFFGLSILFKAQIGIVILGIFSWVVFVKRIYIRKLIPMFFTLFVISFLGTFLDFLFYENIVFTPYNFIKGNLVGGRSNDFGTSPFYYYLKIFLMAAIPPISIVLPLFFLFGLRKLKKSVFVWILIPYILVHFIIPHKEVRFMLPVYYLIIFVTIYGLSKYFENREIKPYQNKIFKVTVVLNFVVMTYMIIKPANGTVLYAKYLYDHINEGNRTIVTTEKDYYTIMGDLQTTFYTPKNVKS